MEFEVLDRTPECGNFFHKYTAVTTGLLAVEGIGYLSPTYLLEMFEAERFNVAQLTAAAIVSEHFHEKGIEPYKMVYFPDDSIACVNTVARKWYLYQVEETTWEVSMAYCDLEEAGATLKDIQQDYYIVENVDGEITMTLNLTGE